MKASIAANMLTFFVASISMLASPMSSKAEESLAQALENGKFLTNIRIRYEYVDQDGIANDAQAKTARVRLGYETGSWKDFSLLGEIDGTTHFGSEEFNSTVNGKTTYPIVADPDSFRLNRANLKYTGLQDTTAKIGRQRIILGDARFVGNVGWRQNEQTFDSLRVTNTAISNVKIDYSYIWQVNSIFGSEAALGDFSSNSHLIDIQYSELPYLNITGFGHWLDFEEAKKSSSLATYGVRLKGNIKGPKTIKFGYGATIAHQENYADNNADVSEDYYAVSGSVLWKNMTARLGYDVFTGNGTVAFQTPLATGHKFQGLADVFLTTPGDGLEDFHVSLAYQTPSFFYFPKGINVQAAYHDFSAENGSTDMGSEVDILAIFPLDHGFKIVTMYADYDGANFAADRQKFSFGLNYNF
ncbi:hypothetical protein NBZ79_08655 [Sneathiella marina]|uniref:Alginate export domain-containing protein n=1 Tax=Sneathiella marina TaxID=2950108 RepID=A0ABY4W7M5_9PROT|nr:hypothetical protein [Sneathiella marina]USG63048.1 hypothetical protein NBZ79_08655 [Sneathiella marina]